MPDPAKWFAEKMNAAKGSPEFQREVALIEFAERLIKSQKEIDPEISRAVHEHFWEFADVSKAPTMP